MVNMAKSKQIMVTLSGKDLTTFDKTVNWLKEKNIEIKEAEVMRVALRGYYKLEIIKELGERLDKQISPKKKDS